MRNWCHRASTHCFDSGSSDSSDSHGTPPPPPPKDSWDSLGKGTVHFLVFARAATLSGLSCHSNMGLGMEQNTQSTFPYGNFQVFCFFSPTVLFLTIRVLMAVGVKDTMTSFSPPVLGWGHFPPSAFSTEHEIVPMGLRDGGKLAAHEEDLRGIPACEAEIGKGAVVITDCGIDVVHINQNCWINKNCLGFFYFFCQGAFPKSISISLGLPLLNIFQCLHQVASQVFVSLFYLPRRIFYLFIFSHKKIAV